MKDQAKNFEILSRVDTQKFLVTAGLSATNFHNPESLAKLSAATGADVVLFGTLVLEKNMPLLLFSSAKRPVERGTVSFSVVFTEQGKLKDVRVVHSLDPTLDQAAIEAIRKWSANPAKDASGNPVPVRVHVEVSFQPFSRLY